MRLEFTRQTRWAESPEPRDPEEHPAGGIYVQQMLWVACNDCDLQVHAPLSHCLASGLVCPECGRRLTSPRVLGNPDVAVARLREAEEMLRDQVEPGTPFLEQT